MSKKRLNVANCNCMTKTPEPFYHKPGCPVLENNFMDMFDKIQTECHSIAKTKGWWDTDRNDGELIALMHSELSEALEGLRKGNGPDDKIPKFNSLEAELADTIIRIMDFSEARGLRLSEAIIAKKKFNMGRSYRHGNKTC